MPPINRLEDRFFNFEIFTSKFVNLRFKLFTILDIHNTLEAFAIKRKTNLRTGLFVKYLHLLIGVYFTQFTPIRFILI